MSLVVPIKVRLEVSVVVWSTKYRDGGYIVAHGVTLLIILCWPEGMRPTNRKWLVDIEVFFLWWVMRWRNLGFIDALAQQCLDA